MKILMPWFDQLNYSPDDPRITSGVSAFMKLMIEHIPGVMVFPLEYREGDDKVDVNYFKWLRDQVRQEIIRTEPDVLLVNHIRGAFMSSYLDEFDIPIMVINHTQPYVPSKINNCFKITRRGHSVYYVSEFQFNQWNEKCRWGDLECHGYISPSFCSGDIPEILDEEYDCCTIGRCSSEKGPFKLKNMTKKEDLRTLVMTTEPWKERDIKYYENNKHFSDVLMGLPHDEVITNLSKSRTYFSTWQNETWGITSLEALSVGVPVILNSRGGSHASTIIPADDSHMKLISSCSKKELISAIRSTFPPRKEIQDMTWEKHSKKRWMSQILNAIDATIERHKKVPSLIF